MKKYNVIVQDIYERNKQKHITIQAVDHYLAHKNGLKHTNALREEIAIIRDQNNSIVFSYKDGFISANE
jgi:ABC-type transport system involved in cytochrome c biogenesis ATPase subunit